VTIARLSLVLLFTSVSSLALAQSSGTPQEQAACQSDVRRLCSRVPRGSDNMEYLKCLELNRDRLSKQCLAVLIDHGR
jgi:hypothetical protein